MARRPSLQSPWFRAAALGFVMLVVAIVAILLHRRGHTQGDDFALYLRQARSVFDGDTSAVVADNRFAVLNSDSGFSPIAYPWGWPLLLAPFVHLWGLDYDRLKLIEVGLFITWLVLMYGIVRRRIGRWMALAFVAVIGTAPEFLLHTDQLLSEFPYLAAVALFVWWYDRIRSRSALVNASTRDLVILGALVTVAFNIRREGIVLIAVIAVIQLAELLSRAGPPKQWLSGLAAGIESTWRKLLVPHVTFVVTAVLFQLFLPTTLLPDDGNSRQYIDDRFADYPAVLTQQLGLGKHPAVGVLIVVIALVGVVVGVRQRPAMDGPLALLAFFSALTISTHFRTVARYWFQVTPWVLYFAAVAVWTVARWSLRRRPYVALSLCLVPLLFLVGVHAAVLPGTVSDARKFNDAGRVQVGPANPGVIPIFDAVLDHTPPTAVVAYFRARTMTLLTDRRSIQTANLDRLVARADYFAQRRGRVYWQPDLTEAEARDLGFEKVWSDPLWILWRIPRP